MKVKILKWLVTFTFVLVALAMVACTPQTMGGQEDVTMMATPDGAILVDTFATTATVTAIDTTKRKLTLVYQGGLTSTYKAGSEVVNFGQIKVGDQVRATLTEEAAIYIGKGAPPSAAVGTTVALAPVGAKPGGMFVDTMQITAKIGSVDPNSRKVTLLFPDGTSKTVKVGKQVDINSVMPGNDVTVLVSEGIALSVEKP